MKSKNDDLKPEYDFSNGVKGKYVSRLAKGANVAVLDSDVASIFPDSASVNDALRALAQIIQARSPKGSSRQVKHT
ncbi:MAG: hypothetical protein Q8O24_02615 [Gallionellaceae bacterium]|nr:hypothetical protein [Gallionellaceae bacterium]